MNAPRKENLPEEKINKQTNKNSRNVLVTSRENLKTNNSEGKRNRRLNFHFSVIPTFFFFGVRKEEKDFEFQRNFLMEKLPDEINTCCCLLLLRPHGFIYDILCFSRKHSISYFFFYVLGPSQTLRKNPVRGKIGRGFPRCFLPGGRISQLLLIAKIIIKAY